MICDGYLRETSRSNDPLAGYEYYEPHDEATRQLTAHGDLLVREMLVAEEKITRQAIEEMGILRRNARRQRRIQAEQSMAAVEETENVTREVAEAAHAH